MKNLMRNPSGKNGLCRDLVKEIYSVSNKLKPKYSIVTPM